MAPAVTPLTILKTIRLERRLHRNQVAKAVGVSDRTLSNWEDGRSYPTLPQAAHLADIYCTTVDALLGRDTKPAA